MPYLGGTEGLRVVEHSDGTIERDCRTVVILNLAHNQRLVLVARHRLPVDLDCDILRDERVESSSEVIGCLGAVDSRDVLLDLSVQSEEDRDGLRHSCVQSGRGEATGGYLRSFYEALG